MRPLARIMLLWRGQAGWLLAGLVVAVASVGAGVALLVLAAQEVSASAPDRTGPVLLGGVALAVLVRGLGVARVLLRYAERLVTHAAMFRAPHCDMPTP